MVACSVRRFCSVLSPASQHGCAHGRRFCSALSPQSSVLLLSMAARTVRRFCSALSPQSSVLLLSMAARSVAAFAQPSVLSPQSCFSAWLRAPSPPLLLSPQSSALSPQPSALSPQSSVLSPQSSALSPQSSVLSPQSCFSAWLRGKSRFFFLNRVLYKSIIRGILR
jgi:hypothetical protein